MWLKKIKDTNNTNYKTIQKQRKMRGQRKLNKNMKVLLFVGSNLRGLEENDQFVNS